jgi:hypothetical protein
MEVKLPARMGRDRGVRALAEVMAVEKVVEAKEFTL